MDRYTLFSYTTFGGENIIGKRTESPLNIGGTSLLFWPWPMKQSHSLNAQLGYSYSPDYVQYLQLSY